MFLFRQRFYSIKFSNQFVKLGKAGRPLGSKKSKNHVCESNRRSPKVIKKEKPEFKHEKPSKHTDKEQQHLETTSKPGPSEQSNSKTTDKKKNSPKEDRKVQKSPKKKDDTPKKTATGYIHQIRRLNPYITCPLCEGYFVDATTVLDCLHTFCRSCLLKYFEEENNNCPKCQNLIHQSHPSQYVAFDRTMQDIVYKLVPGMQEQESLRRAEFYKKKRLEKGDDSDDEEEFPSPYTNGINHIKKEPRPPSRDDNCCGNSPVEAHHRSDDAVVIELVPGVKELEALERPYIRLSGFATINTIKRYIALILLHDLTKYNDYDIFCNNELMGRDYSMAFILKTRWRNKPKGEPLKLFYRAHIDF